MALSPFLNQNPKDLAYALGETGRNLELATGEWYEILVTLGGGIIFSSGRLREQSLKTFGAEVKFYRRREKVRVKLQVTRFKLGFPYQATFRLKFKMTPPNSKGQVSINLSGPVVQSSGAMRQSRAWASRINKQFTRGAKLASPRSTALRPALETLVVPFLKTEQFGDPANFTTLQSILPITTYSRSWSGTRTPGWGSKKPRAYVDNNHSVGIVDVGENKSSWYQERPANGTFHLILEPYLNKFPLPAKPVTHLDLAEFNALKRLIANANQGIQANLAQNIAQVSQLATLITGNISAILRALKYLKRGNIPASISQLRAGRLDPRWKGVAGVPSVKKSLANNWLELQYGWKPLLHDIEGFFKIMSGLQGDTDFVQKVRSKASAEREYRTSEPDTTVMHGKNAGRTTFHYRTSTKFGIRFRIDNPLLNLFSQTGFTNPVALTWEILPFSFVADWFLPIGSYLEALNAWEGATFLGGYRTRFTRLRRNTTVAYSGPHPADSQVNVLNYANYYSEAITLDRVALTSFPSPVLPSFNMRGIEGGNRAANAIALLTKAFK